MKYQTHVYLAEVLFPVICEKWGVTLSKKKFIEGSVKPDTCSLFFRHPHFWKQSRSYVFHKIRTLSKMRLKHGKKNKKFCEALGITLHYVADFFTAAHNIKPNKLKQHIAFESKLHEEFIGLVKSENLRTSFLLITETVYDDCSIEDTIRSLYKDYHPSMNDPLADIREIILACVTVTTWVMNAVTANAAVFKECPKHGERFIDMPIDATPAYLI